VATPSFVASCEPEGGVCCLTGFSCVCTNVWNTTRLFRGNFCGDAGFRPYLCPPNAALAFESCSIGRFECFLANNSFEGECVEWADIGELEACIEGNVGYDCDPSCYESCVNASCSAEFCNVDGCFDLCCEPTGTPPDGPGCG
jgi:hypothetical protein